MPFLLAYWKVSYQNINKISNFLASLCSWEGFFEHDLIGNPKDRFSDDEPHMENEVDVDLKPHFVAAHYLFQQ